GVADDLWSTRELRDFDLQFKWRWPDLPHIEVQTVIDSNGDESTDANGAMIRERVLEAGSSGLYLRGYRKAEANLFCYQIGSGQFREYREKVNGHARRILRPQKRADRPI